VIMNHYDVTIYIMLHIPISYMQRRRDERRLMQESGCERYDVYDSDIAIRFPLVVVVVVINSSSSSSR
jgi:hypothetical protein